MSGFAFFPEVIPEALIWKTDTSTTEIHSEPILKSGNGEFNSKIKSRYNAPWILPKIAKSIYKN